MTPTIDDPPGNSLWYRTLSCTAFKVFTTVVASLIAIAVLLALASQIGVAEAYGLPPNGDPSHLVLAGYHDYRHDFRLSM